MTKVGQKSSIDFQAEKQWKPHAVSREKNKLVFLTFNAFFHCLSQEKQHPSSFPRVNFFYLGMLTERLWADT